VSSQQPIGIFDSGLGGLSVLREVWQQLPLESTVYIADQANLPYGTRPAGEIQALSEAIMRQLLRQKAKLVFVACNTASAAALDHLRSTFPDTAIVGMEPAVKPATAHTRSGVIGVLATGSTLQADRYASLVTRFARDTSIIPIAAPELVEIVEAGLAASEQCKILVRRILAKPLAQGMDTLVLGCTHFQFLKKTIRDVGGPELVIIDPNAAVAGQAGRVLAKRNLSAGKAANRYIKFQTTGNLALMHMRLLEMLGKEWDVSSVPGLTTNPTHPGRG